MKYFLVVYSRGDQRILDFKEYPDSASAVRERFRQEAEVGPDVEVVVLGAESREALERTHSRYFGVRPELTEVG